MAVGRSEMYISFEFYNTHGNHFIKGPTGFLFVFKALYILHNADVEVSEKVVDELLVKMWTAVLNNQPSIISNRRENRSNVFIICYFGKLDFCGEEEHEFFAGL